MFIKSYNLVNNGLLGQVKVSKYGLRELCNMKVVSYEK